MTFGEKLQKCRKEAARLTVYDQGAYGVLAMGGVSLCFALPDGAFVRFWE